MNFFLVFQGDTYEEEKILSCLWAPKLNKAGHEVHHHRRLLDVDIGDQVVHLENRKIRAISKAKSKALIVNYQQNLTDLPGPRMEEKLILI